MVNAIEVVLNGDPHAYGQMLLASGKPEREVAKIVNKMLYEKAKNEMRGST